MVAYIVFNVRRRLAAGPSISHPFFIGRRHLRPDLYFPRPHQEHIFDFQEAQVFQLEHHLFILLELYILDKRLD
jgi:hypothetical protein